MIINSAQFAFSSSAVSQIPANGGQEFAFIGRSNVGKSSLINMLCASGALAKVSSTPGKTRLINHFLINSTWYLVDLPGYGYARADKRSRRQFGKIITDYILHSPKLHYLFVLVDSRHEMQKIDLDFMTFLAENGIPFGIVFTKCDKQSNDQTASNVAAYSRSLSSYWEELPTMFLTSSAKRKGRDEILEFIDRCIKQ